MPVQGVTFANRIMRSSPGFAQDGQQPAVAQVTAPAVNQRPYLKPSAGLYSVYFGIQSPARAPHKLFPDASFLSTLQGNLVESKHSIFAPDLKDVLGDTEKQWLKQTARDGFLRMPPQEAMTQLMGKPKLVLRLIQAAASAHQEIKSSATPDIRDPFQLSETPIHGLNIANLTHTVGGVRETGDIWKAIIYLLTLPNKAIHLLPWHEKDLGSNYIANNPYRVDPGIESSFLKQHGIKGVDQLRLLGEVGHAMGKQFVYDLLPHAAHFGTPVLLNPEAFRWIQFDLEKIRALAKTDSSTGDKQCEILRYQNYQHLVQGSEQEARQRLELYAQEKLLNSGIVKPQSQEQLVRKVAQVVEKHMGDKSRTCPPESVSEEVRDRIAQDLIQQGLWTLPRSGYDSLTYFPLVRGYNLSGNYPLYTCVDRVVHEGKRYEANHQMFPFTRYQFRTAMGITDLNVVDLYSRQLTFADSLGLADLVRLDQLDWFDRESHLYDPMLREAVLQLPHRFPNKAFIAERLNNFDLSRFQQVGISAITGSDFDSNLSDSHGYGQDFFHRQWEEDDWLTRQRLVNYTAQQPFTTPLRMFQNHDQHLQPSRVSPFDPARNGVEAGIARLITFLFINGGLGSPKPYYDIMGDQVGLPGQHLYRSMCQAGHTTVLDDPQSINPIYNNALSLRYGTPNLKKILQRIDKVHTRPLHVSEDEKLSALVYRVMKHGRKTWDSWSSNGDVVAWAIERADKSPGKVIVVVNRKPTEGWRGPTSLSLDANLLQSSTTYQIELAYPEGPKFQKLKSEQGLLIENLPPLGYRLFYCP